MHARVRLAAAALFTLAACQCANLSGLEFPCEEGGGCPAGESCQPDGYCRPGAPAADAGDGGADAGFDAGLDAGLDAGFDAGLDGGDDGGCPAPVDAGGCPIVVQLTDEFDGAMIGPQWGQAPGGGAITQALGQLRLTPPQIASGYVTLYSTALHDIRDSSVFAYLSQPASVDTTGGKGTDTYLVVVGNGQYAQLVVQTVEAGRTLHAYRGPAGGANVVLKSTPFNQLSMRFLRLRQGCGRVFYEFAQFSRGPWQRLTEIADPFDGGLVQVNLGVGAFGPGPYTNGTAAYFERVNLCAAE